MEPALAQLDEGVRSAAAAGAGMEQRLRISVLPSFAQHWLLPRLAGWREAHPDITLDIHNSQQLVDLPREGFHAALRQGAGPWRGLEGTCLVSSPMIVVAAPSLTAQMPNFEPATLAHQPLLGSAGRWERWFALAGHVCKVRPAAVFNDMSLSLQAAERGLGISMARTLQATDALLAGRLVQLSPVALDDEADDCLWLVHPPERRDWPPLVALRAWLLAELAKQNALG